MVNARSQSKIPEKYQPYVARRQQQKVEMRSRIKRRHQLGLQRAAELASILKSEFGVTKVSLFGSMLSVNDIHMASDIDIAVWGLRYADYIPALSKLMTATPEFSVDLVRIEEASPSLSAYILEKGLVIGTSTPPGSVLGRGSLSMSNYLVLIGRIRQELEDIEGQYAQTKLQLAVARETGQSAYWMAVSLGMHGIYTGLEKIFQQIASKVDGDFTKSDQWHKSLLEQMAINIPSVRPAVIDKPTFLALEKYLSFRHVVRSNYAYRLEPKRIDANFQVLENCYESLTEQIIKLCNFLETIN